VDANSFLEFECAMTRESTSLIALKNKILVPEK
jgi:hypothetical protein